MKYLLHKFRSPANSRAYVDNWDAVFGEPKPEPLCSYCKHPERDHTVDEGWSECLHAGCSCGVIGR